MSTRFFSVTQTWVFYSWPFQGLYKWPPFGLSKGHEWKKLVTSGNFTPIFCGAIWATLLIRLVVSTHLKNISQIGSFPQIGVKIKNIWVATTQLLILGLFHHISPLFFVELYGPPRVHHLYNCMVFCGPPLYPCNKPTEASSPDSPCDITDLGHVFQARETARRGGTKGWDSSSVYWEPFFSITAEQWKKGPWLVGLYRGWNPTQFYRDYNKPRNKDPY